MAESPREVAMSYIKSIGGRDYATARNYLGDNVWVKGLAGETFRSPDEFLKMMERQHGNTPIKKIFVDSDDVCFL